MKTKMYVLVCPTTLKVRYVGITKEKYLSKRLGGHIFDSINRNGKTHHHYWVRSLIHMGLRPIIRKIGEYDSWEEARKVELCMINKHKTKHKLTNTYDEGKFKAVGIKSARVYFTKPIYLYDENGKFVKEFPSSAELCKELNITKLTAKKILARKKRFGKNITYKFQLSRVKLSTLPPILDIGSRSSTSPLFE